LNVSATTGGIAAQFDGAADVGDQQHPVLEMSKDSTPKGTPGSATFPFRHNLSSPSLPGNEHRHQDYVNTPRQQTHWADANQVLHSILNAHSSSSTGPWTPLRTTGLPNNISVEQYEHWQRLQSSGTVDGRSDKFRDSGIGTLPDASQHDTLSQLSSPTAVMNEQSQPFPDQGLWPMPEDVTYTQDDDDDVDDAVGEVEGAPRSIPDSPTTRRSGKNDTNTICPECGETSKTPSDLK
jgi:hypothetical protein